MSYPVLYSKTERKNIPAIAGIAVAGASIVGDTSRNEVPFTTQGLGTLSDCISCLVTEERNGAYELTMQYPISGVHFKEIELRGFVLAKPNYTDAPQPFRVYAISKPLNGICTINAQHISYDLSGKEIPMGVTAANLTAAVRQLSAYSAPFKIKTTKTGPAPFKTDVPSSVRSWLGGKEGSLLDLYGGEWHWDGYECTLSTARGVNRGVTIRYGKNLTSLKQDEECSNVYSGVRAYYTTSEGMTISGGLVRTGITLDMTRTFFLDASGYFGSNVPNVAQLNAYAAQYIMQNGLNAPKVNLTLNFVQLQGLAERVDLCDTVTIQFEALGVSATAKCIQTTWDVLQERYTSTTFGDAKSNLNSTLNGIQTKITSDMSVAIRKSAADTKSELERAIDNATSKITGNAGGYVVLHDTDDNGEPDEILIMDTDDISTATKVWRWNKSGLGYSDTGYDGSYGLAITADGQIVADYVATGKLDANVVNVINLDASNINTGTLNAARIAANSIAVEKLTGSITNSGWGLDFTNGTFSIGNLSAGKITSGTIAAARIAANSIAVSKLTGSISNGQWKIDLDNGTFSIGNLSADKITAGTITGAITATNFTMTGGSINIDSNTATEDRISLNYKVNSSVTNNSTLSPSYLALTQMGSVRTYYGFNGLSIRDMADNIQYLTISRAADASNNKGGSLSMWNSDDRYPTVSIFGGGNGGQITLQDSSRNGITITKDCNVATLSYSVVSTF